ncbi:type II secretion system F family protein [Streptomyces sp. NPDC020965]|uniref:type II secretion system F family protein n=1 Tax=Streptomyces sp. NPDC020965 TaxID=3365105 RepID=UPI0037B2FCD4
MTGDVPHGPWAVLLALAVAAWLGHALIARHRGRTGRRRADALLGQEPERPRRRPAYGLWTRRLAPPLGAVVTGYVLVEGVLGGLIGLAAAGALQHRRGGWRALVGRPGPTAVGPGAAVSSGGGAVSGGAVGGGDDHRLPLAADLLAACVSAGAGPREAAEAVGDSLGGPIGDRLVRAAAELRLGGEPSRAWRWFGEIPGAAELARCLERADSTGAPVAEPVSRLAERLRADRARTAAARSRRAQVLITAPVGLCFLPAFLAVGVAPVVIGLAGGLLNGD